MIFLEKYFLTSHFFVDSYEVAKDITENQRIPKEPLRTRDEMDSLILSNTKPAKKHKSGSSEKAGKGKKSHEPQAKKKLKKTDHTPEYIKNQLQSIIEKKEEAKNIASTSNNSSEAGEPDGSNKIDTPVSSVFI